MSDPDTQPDTQEDTRICTAVEAEEDANKLQPALGYSWNRFLSWDHGSFYREQHFHWLQIHGFATCGTDMSGAEAEEPFAEAPDVRTALQQLAAHYRIAEQWANASESVWSFGPEETALSRGRTVPYVFGGGVPSCEQSDWHPIIKRIVKQRMRQPGQQRTRWIGDLAHPAELVGVSDRVGVPVPRGRMKKLDRTAFSADYGIYLQTDALPEFIVRGFASQTGYEDELTQARAEAIKKYLVQQGIPADRVRAEGGKPYAASKDAEGEEIPENRAAFVFLRYSYRVILLRAPDKSARGSDQESENDLWNWYKRQLEACQCEPGKAADLKERMLMALNAWNLVMSDRRFGATDQHYNWYNGFVSKSCGPLPMWEILEAGSAEQGGDARSPEDRYAEAVKAKTRMFHGTQCESLDRVLASVAVSTARSVWETLLKTAGTSPYGPELRRSFNLAPLKGSDEEQRANYRELVAKMFHSGSAWWKPEWLAEWQSGKHLDEVSPHFYWENYRTEEILNNYEAHVCGKTVSSVEGLT